MAREGLGPGPPPRAARSAPLITWASGSRSRVEGVASAIKVVAARSARRCGGQAAGDGRIASNRCPWSIAPIQRRSVTQPAASNVTGQELMRRRTSSQARPTTPNSYRARPIAAAP